MRKAHSVFSQDVLKTCLISKVCFLVSDNGFLQIFCNCFYVGKIFSWHNGAFSLSQNVQQKFFENRLTIKISCKGGKYFPAKNLISWYFII